MPTALITGATGLLGRAVFDAFDRRTGDGEGGSWTAVGTGLTRAEPPKYRKVDLLDERAVEDVMGEVKPQVVVHCAADRSPDSCARNPALARRINVSSTAHLSRLCHRHRILLIYISTDYVFPGFPGAKLPYSALSTPQPTNVYGETKLEGERAVLARNDKVAGDEDGDGDEDEGDFSGGSGSGIVLRVPVLYGRTSPHDNYSESAVNVLVDAVYKSQQNQKKEENENENEKKNKVIMDDWAQRYPTATEDVARVCVDIARSWLNLNNGEERAAWPRILQFTAEERMTKYRMCEVLAEILGLPLDGIVANREGPDPKAKAVQRPYDTHLGTEELRGLGVDVSYVKFEDWW